jgi:flagellin-like protein
MKANRRFVNEDEAVSPVIAVILMVAITVVLAATVYLWVSGFGNQNNELVQASFTAKAVDYPLGTARDADSSDDAIEITYSSGSGDLSATDVEIFVDGVSLSWLSADDNFYESGAFAAGDMCTSAPGGDADDTWERGASLFLMDTSGTGANTDCDGPNLASDFNTIKGIHLIKIVVKGQVVLDTSLEVHDDAAA